MTKFESRLKDILVEISISDGDLSDIDRAVSSIKSLINTEGLGKDKKNIWYQASGQDCYSSNDAYKDGECNGYNFRAEEARTNMGITKE